MSNVRAEQDHRLLIVVPVYNHALSLRVVLDSLVFLAIPVLIVDDGSQPPLDRSILPNPDFSMLTHSENKGKGAALTSAYHWASAHGFTHLLSFDADGQHLARSIYELRAASEQAPAAIILGDRDFKNAASGDIPTSSRFGRAFSNFWIWVESGTYVSDTQTGLRVYPIDSGLFESVRGKRYAFEIEVLTRALWQKRVIVSVKTEVYYPPRQERISHFRAGADNLGLSLTHTRLCCLRLLQLLGVWRMAPLCPTREVRGAGWSALFIKYAGARLAYGLMVFPLLSSFIFRASARGAILEFYRRLQPDRSESQHYFAAFSNFWYFGASIVDRLRVHSNGLIRSPKSPESHFPPPGSILVGAHFGDWFLIAREAAMLQGKTLGLVMDPRINPAFFEAMRDKWQEGLKLLSPGLDHLGFALSVKEILDDGGRVCFMMDRIGADAKDGESRIAVKFLEGAIDFLGAPFILARRLRVPLHFICALKQGLGPEAPYQVHAFEIWDGQDKVSESELANRAALYLETQVRREPQHWFNFFSIWQEDSAL